MSKTEPAKTPERFIPAAESRFATSAEFTYPLTSYTAEAGTPLEHLSRPEYWANLKALKAGCRIWAMPEDESWWAELLVRQVGQGFAKVALLRAGDLDAIEIDPQIAKDFNVEYRGAVKKHRVVRIKDGHVLKEGLATYEDAQAWIRDHKRVLAG